jgi:hypothetical protein
MDRKQLAVCAIFENEAPYLPEWLAYHQTVGVGHFVLYDNGSTDDPARAIRNTRLAEHVTLINWPQRPGQVTAYRHFIDIFAPGFEWVAFLDPDEFLLPLNGGSVVDTLAWLSSAAAVLVHRRVFGPGLWQEPPPGLVIENFSLRAADDFPANRHVKTIARCSELQDVTQDAQEFRINGPVFNTAGHLAPNSAIQAQPCYQNLVINHYCARSRQDFKAKLQRQRAMADATMPPDPAGLLDELAASCRVPDATIQAFAPAVRQLLGGSLAGPSAAGQAAPTPAVADPVAGQTAPAASGPVVASTVVAASPVVVTAGAVAAPETLTMPQAALREMATESTVVPDSAESTGAPDMAESRVAPEAVVSAVLAALTEKAPAFGGGVAGQSPPPPPPIAVPADGASAWVARGQDAQERFGGLALVFRDRSRAGEHWLAALRGAAAAAIDPTFLMDDYDRIRDFTTDAEARQACESALATGPRH